MQALYNCYVAHKGGTTMVLPLENVTTAEIHVLRQIHGTDSVKRIVKIGMRNISDANELNRLRRKYRLAQDHEKKLVVDAMWPGINPTLPVELEKPKVVKQKGLPKLGGRSEEFVKEVYEDTLLDKPVPLDGNEFDGEDFEQQTVTEGDEPPEGDDDDDDAPGTDDLAPPASAAPRPAKPPKRGATPITLPKLEDPAKEEEKLQ